MENRTTIKILVLDDEPFMLKLLDRMLRNSGYPQVSTCDNGQQALVLVGKVESYPDVILLDINMPQMDGVEFVRHLVEHRYLGSLILVSGEDERVLQSVETLVRAHKISVLGHLRKPVKPLELCDLLATWTTPVGGVDRKVEPPIAPVELARAIAQGELLNYYQPKVRVASGEVLGLETLVRWQHPTRGMVPPDQFIGIAEQHGLIDDLTRVVLAAALAQARVWKDAGLVLRVAVNLSMDNLMSLNFLDELVDLTTRAGVAPQDMILEVTESRLMHDQRIPLEILTRLHLKRFHLSIDDFGTGNSSLSQLRDIPFDELKIDKTFVHGAWANPTQRAIFDASVGLARQLKMESVAEGVEDRPDWDFLRQRGCDLAQGYFIAKPMPAQDLPAWLTAWDLRRSSLCASDEAKRLLPAMFDNAQTGAARTEILGACDA
jgi:EAL domain-containing protein (putative c-di-GMP-specific phosphodiesterase class I)/ActR/RegA family two-component response regulator